MENTMQFCQVRLGQVKESAKRWERQGDAADVLAEVVRNIVQVLAEADEYSKLGVKRAIVEDAMVVYNTAAVHEALATLREDNTRGARLADHYSDLFNWYLLLAKCRTFKDWDECRGNVVRIRSYYLNAFASVVHNSNKLVAYFEHLASQYRADVVRANKAMFPKVAVSKADRKEAVKMFICQHTMVAARDIGVMSNANMYRFARYHHTVNKRRTRGFDTTFKVWANAIRVRAMFPRC